MLFNSIDFAIFLPCVFALYWAIPRDKVRVQNLFLVLASYVFYAFWDWRFLSLIALSSIVDYAVGIGLSLSTRQRARTLLLATSLTVNLGALGFFKYYDFFVESMADAFSVFGMPLKVSSLEIVLPAGISFYTFQTLSYSIDVYRRKVSETRDIVSFFAFVSFFPQLVAGPIERAQSLLPQFTAARSFDYDAARDGMRQILWGLFKKAVIADNCARYVDLIFGNYTEQPASSLMLGAVLFGFQIYGDFSGYSDIAIGTARLFGFRLRRNFAFPYFSRDVAEFWRRWHLSLTSWFRDYVYIPLGGSRAGTLISIRNTFIVFLVSGLWHGANWTFIAWGLVHAVCFLPLLLLARNRRYTGSVAEGRLIPSAVELFQMLTTFSIVSLAWVFFRSETLPDAVAYLRGLASWSLLTAPAEFPQRVLAITAFMFALEWLHRDKQHGLQLDDKKWPRPIRWVLYQLLCFSIYSFGVTDQEFIYFQF